MSESFLATRGCVYQVSSGGSGGKGLYDIRPPIAAPGGSSPVVIEGIDLSDQDSVLPIATVENYKVIYTSGSDFGQVRINGLCLLGAVDDASSGEAFAAVKAYFDANRIAVKRAPISISMPGGKAYNVYLTGMAYGQPDAVFNIQPFAFVGILA